MKNKLFGKTINVMLILIFFVSFSLAGYIPLTYVLEMKVKELQSKKTDPPETIHITLYATDEDASKIDLSFFVKHNYRV
ncbi:MAG: hypothetical protein LBI80_02145 [Endomicrobium sp.]|jgi:hypothetical protein|nr:hypothetical protein [Endomicrobium sp.]